MNEEEARRSPLPEPPAPGDEHTVPEHDVPTSPGIGPREAASAPPDETARTTPFVRAPEAAATPATQGVLVDVDGGWTLEADKTEPHHPVVAPAVTTPIVQAVPPAPAEETKTAPLGTVEPAKTDEPPAPETSGPSPTPSPAPTEPSPPAAEPETTLPGVTSPSSDEPAAAAAPVEPAEKDDDAEIAAPPAEPEPAAPQPTPKPDREPIEVRVFGRTDVGLVREHNEDNFLIADLSTGNRSLLPEVRRHVVGGRGSLFVVCDGMGGAAAGEVASLLAVDTIYERLHDSPAPKSGVDLARTMVEAIEEAGRQIFSAARLDRTRRGMGTTVTGACVLDGTLYLAQVGDSRAYVVRGSRIEQVTRDQSLVNQLIEAGQLTEEEAEAFEHSNIILQALGTAADVSVDVTHVPLRRGDILIVCSDGLSGAVSGEQMKEVVLSTPEPIDACKKLTEMANAAGGHDNITVIVAEFEGEGLPEPQPEDRVVFQRVSLPLGPRASMPTPLPPDASASAPSYRQTQPDIDIPQTESGEPDARPRRGGGLTLFLLLLALLVGAAVAYVLFSGMLTANAPAPVQTAVAAPMPSPGAGAAAVGTASVPIVSRALAGTRFRSSIANGHVHVDGVDHGVLADGGLRVMLPVGDHEVSLVVDGAPVATRRIVVVEGTENEFSFGEADPGGTGTTTDAPAPLAPVAPVPTGVAPPPSDSERPVPARPVVRPPVRPRPEPGKSPQTLVPPRSGEVVPANPFSRSATAGQQL